MNIIVLVKQVPDTTEMKIDKENGTLIRTGVASIANPDDLAGVEEALRLKDAAGAHVRVITMGPNQAVGMLRELLGMGVDDVTLISDPKFAGADTWATSNTLAAAAGRYPYDLIIAGRQAIDGDTAQVGPQVAERLNLPQVTYVEEVMQLKEGVLRVKKAYEEHSEILEVTLPALITTLQTMNTPRYGNVNDIVDAFDKEIEVLRNDDLNLEASRIGLKGSPTMVKKTFTRELLGTNEVHQVSPLQAAEAIARLLQPFVE